MQISDAEWQVMKIIWMQGEQTSTDLIKVLEKRFSWSKSTIQTLLARLVEKECLTREKQGKSFVYSSLLTPDDSRDLMVQDIKDKLCSRRIKLLLADLIEECDFTLADLEGLEEVISKKKASAVTEVRCSKNLKKTVRELNKRMAIKKFEWKSWGDILQELLF